ncbi:MAG: hypothetical protein SFW64_06345 [Alphaproteobacteria bacterium]|nr:hypothetical protein [Alphaproteobacteria bacterium]
MNEAASPETVAEPEVATKRTKSKGERLFDWLVYGGIAGVGTFIATVPLTYLLKHTAAGGVWYQKAVSGVRGLLERGLSKPTSAAAAEDAVMTTVLMMGGNAMLLPVGLAEKHKVSTVNGLNTILGDTTPTREIEQKPKQTWGSLIKARIMAWFSVFATFTGASWAFPQTFATFKHEFAEGICTLFRKPVQVVKEHKMVPSRTYLLGQIGALDLFATAAAASLLYVGGHFFARKQEERRQHRAQGHGATLADWPDRAAAEVSITPGAPSATLEGTRRYEGRAQDPAIVAQL